MAFYQEIVPGTYFGVSYIDEEHTGILHTNTYDFNDKILGIACSVFVRVIEKRLKITL